VTPQFESDADLEAYVDAEYAEYLTRKAADEREDDREKNDPGFDKHELGRIERLLEAAIQREITAGSFPRTAPLVEAFAIGYRSGYGQGFADGLAEEAMS
jgi:hypothetical protein